MKHKLLLSLAFLSLLSCEKEKDKEIPPGTIEINLDWREYSTPQHITVGFGYSSTDIANNAFFYNETFDIVYPTTRPPAKVTKTGLKPGIYYYKVSKPEQRYGNSAIQIYHIHAFEKSGALTVTSGQTTTESVYVDGGGGHEVK